MAPSPKQAPRMGDDVAGMCRTVDRIDGISRKLDLVIAAQTDVLRRIDALEAKNSKTKR
jgi:hypothetical protein